MITNMREFLNESISNDNTLRKIANDVSNKLYCDKFGSCVHFAEEFVLEVYKVNPNLLEGFSVVEGYVDWEFGDDIPQQHTWIELSNGEKIDPTFEQFTKYGWADYSQKRSTKFNGLDYYNDTILGTWFSDRRKKYPKDFYKEIN
jgi:hypothetical protein